MSRTPTSWYSRCRGGSAKVVHRGGYYPRYLSSGHLVYVHEATLFSIPFDLDRLEVTGQAVPVLEGVMANGGTGGTQFAFSQTGTVVYLPGRSIGNSVPIFWMTRDGKTAPLWATSADWSNPHFSPDGRRLAIDISDGRQADIWIYEWARETSMRLTFDSTTEFGPVWTPDGQRIVYNSTRGGPNNLYWQRSDGTGEVQRLTQNKNSQLPGSWHPSGKYLAFQESNPQTQNDLLILPMDASETSGWKPGKPTVFLNTPANEQQPIFSPDGQWIAYQSNDSGRVEIFVRPFPGPGGKWQISTSGGLDPAWSRNRRELFYRAPDGRIMVVSYSVEGNSFKAEKPRVWSERAILGRPRLRAFDLHPDGERFAVAASPEPQTETKQDKIVFIFNFFDELRRLAPAGKRP